MAPNYSFFCLLFSNGAQPRKSSLPLRECFDSGLQRAHFYTNTAARSPLPPGYPQGVTGTHPAPPAPPPLPGVLPRPKMEIFPAQIPFPQSSVSVPRKRAPSPEGCAEMVLLSQTSSSTLGSYWEPEIKQEKRAGSIPGILSKLQEPQPWDFLTQNLFLW